MRKLWKRHGWYLMLGCVGAALIILTIQLTKVDETIVIIDEPVETTTAPIVTTEAPEVEVTTEATTEAEPVPEVVYYDVPLDHDLQDFIRARCGEYGVEMELILAMIETESSFRADAYSKTNDVGLMQINKCNHEWLREELGITDFTDPRQNVLAGVHIIAGHLDKTDGDKHLALMRYNCGASGAKRLWKKGIYNSAYSRKIVDLYGKYKSESMLSLI